jgi:cysteine-rich repeat protein
VPFAIQRFAVDAVGNVVFAGTERDAGSVPHRWVAGLLGGRTGSSRWTSTLEWTGQTTPPGGDVRALSVDSAGDVFVAGNVVFAERSADFAVAKLSHVDGHPLWQWSYDDGTKQWDSATAMVADAAGDVVAVGASGRALASRAPVIKLAGADGSVLWQRDTVFRDWTGWDTALFVETDAHGDVVVGGEVGQEGIAIAKLSGPTGGDFPCGNGIQDEGEACDDGNLTPNDGCESDCTLSATCDDGDPCSRDALEPSGCAFDPIPGIAGQRCVLDEHYPPPACGHLPRGVRKAVQRARKFLEHSLSAPGDKADRGVQRSLDRAGRKISRAHVDDACRNAVLALLADAAARHPL